MKVFTFSEARQQLAALLSQARRDGEARIRRRDGQVFLVRPLPTSIGSPLDVPGVGLDLPQGALLRVLRESRRRRPGTRPQAAPRKAGTRRQGESDRNETRRRETQG